MFVCFWSTGVCVLLHSHFPLQVERLLHIVVATAQVDEGDIAADCHLLLVPLLQLKGALQVLIRQQEGGLQNGTRRQSKLIFKKVNREFCDKDIKTIPTSSAQRLWMSCLRVGPMGLPSAISSASFFSSAATFPSIACWRRRNIQSLMCTSD